MLKLGSITLDAPFFQAPLSGYSDYAMRKLAIDHGAPLTFAGVMLAKSAAHPKILSKPAFRPRDDEHPVGAQILGTDPEMMAKAAKALEQAGYDLIDLNFACPAPKVLRRRRGGFLLNEPETVMEIYRRVRDAVSCPVLMKLRIGFNNSTESRDNFWKIVSDASSDRIDAIAIHGRTVIKKFRDESNWKILAEVKQRFPQTTIIGSGDLFDAQTTADLLKTSCIDGVVIARGAIGNPWIFNELRAILNGQTLPASPSLEDQGRAILKHFELASELYGKNKAVRFLRKFLVGYCKLHSNRKMVQQALLAANDEAQLLVAIKQFYGIC